MHSIVLLLDFFLSFLPGFSGMLHHALITHKGPIDQIMSADFYPTDSTFKLTAGVYGY